MLDFLRQLQYSLTFSSAPLQKFSQTDLFTKLFMLPAQPLKGISTLVRFSLVTFDLMENINLVEFIGGVTTLFIIY